MAWVRGKRDEGENLVVVVANFADAAKTNISNYRVNNWPSTPTGMICRVVNLSPLASAELTRQMLPKYRCKLGRLECSREPLRVTPRFESRYMGSQPSVEWLSGWM